MWRFSQGAGVQLHAGVPCSLVGSVLVFSRCPIEWSCSRVLVVDPLVPVRIVAKAVVKRKPAFYENNVFVMLCVITTIAFSSFCCNGPDDLSQNLENTLTLILTAAAFRFSMEDKLPAVHYMTILDKYILVSFMFMIAIVATSLIGSLVVTPKVESWLELIVFGGFACDHMWQALRTL